MSGSCTRWAPTSSATRRRPSVAIATLALVAALGAQALPAPLAAAEGPVVGTVVELVPSAGSLTWNGRSYAGRLQVRADGDGLTLIEHVSPEDYLLGIREVPFSWPEEALRAQVVAARTYLAWTLERGRSGSGATYGFDICATDACQVYAGLGLVDGPDGDRWLAAVSDTSAEILRFDDRPALAMYSSTAGTRTKSIEDVFVGSAPRPYLRGVPSPGEESPYVSWRFTISQAQLVRVLRRAGIEVPFDLDRITVTDTADGEGPSLVRIGRGVGAPALTAMSFRSVLNRHAPALYPGQFPGRRPDGRRYPQVVLSPTFSVTTRLRFTERTASGDPDISRPGMLAIERVFDVTGSGWGHQVGMSQYGAKAMADAGADYRAILGHYYGGLTPSPAGGLLPDDVSVGLGWRFDQVVIDAQRSTLVLVDGAAIGHALGPITIDHVDGRLSVEAFTGSGVEPDLRAVHQRPPIDGVLPVVGATVTTPVEVRLVVTRAGRVVEVTDWIRQTPGTFSVVWRAAQQPTPGRYRLVMQGRGASGVFDAQWEVDLPG